VLKFHDFLLDDKNFNKPKEEFIKISHDNFLNRQLHHHVFDINLLINIFNYFNIDILFYETSF
jgi:hypothetical protein